MCRFYRYELSYHIIRVRYGMMAYRHGFVFCWRFVTAKDQGAFGHIVWLVVRVIHSREHCSIRQPGVDRVRRHTDGRKKSIERNTHLLKNESRPPPSPQFCE